MPDAPPPLVERLEFVQAPDLPGVACMWAENCGQHYHWFHETYTVATMDDGMGEYACGNEIRRTAPGDVTIWEPGDLHRVRRIDNDAKHGLSVASVRAFLFEPSLVYRAAEECGVPGTALHVREREQSAPQVFRRVSALHDALQRPASRLERESRLAGVLEALVRNWLDHRPSPRRPDPQRRAVRRAADYLIANWSRPVTLEELVLEAGVNRFTLLRAFSREVGCTPHAFLVQVRLAKARRLLARRTPPALVAALTGFSDQSHMIRSFRKAAGVTPGRYLKA